jgi:hypothetical protein
MAALNAAMGNSTTSASVTADREEYAELKTKISTTVDEAEKAKLQNELNEMASSFESTYGFSIDSNIETLQNEMDNLLA